MELNIKLHLNLRNKCVLICTDLFTMCIKYKCVFFSAVSYFVPQYFPQGSLKFHLIWPCGCTGGKKKERKKERKEKPGCGDTPAHHMPHFCCGGQSMLSSAWVMSQVPQKSFTTILCVQKLWRMWHALPGTFSGSRWPGQMVWLKLPPLPLQQEIKHHS